MSFSRLRLVCSKSVLQKVILRLRKTQGRMGELCRMNDIALQPSSVLDTAVDHDL